PNYVFLSETRSSVQEMKAIRIKNGFKNCLAVDTEGRRCRLSLLWNEEVDLSIKSFSQSHFDLSGSTKKWRLMGIYGNPEAHHCHETWSLLCNLASQHNISWLCMGDFNEILSISEKEGGNERNTWQMDKFCHALDTCRLRDMG
ncbi:hypothetical protein CFOL_v3_30074, partial [Cephalotus follicularis]